MSTCLLKTSKFISLLKIIWKRYFYIEESLGNFYKNSQMHYLINKTFGKTKIFFRYSFLGRIAEIKEENNTLILDNSKFTRWLLGVYRTWIDRIMSYSITSAVIKLMKELKKELYLSPIKTVSIILITVILTNVFFSLLLSKRIDLLGWFLRGVLLFVGLAGLSSDATWRDIKKTSYFLNKIKF